jgi:chorismate mutase
MNIKNKNNVLERNNNNALIMITGPCSVESEQQVVDTAMQLKKTSVPFDILRGGIWKPRTRPNAFEGVGSRALAWLKKAGEMIGKPVGTEVATPLHVELCLSHGIDVLWIGARTSANPFAVQAIADALKGVDIPVLVKNPVSPDLALWIGALERINNAGVMQLAAIHRGFSTLDSGEFRNKPGWTIPIELKSRIPELPLICDPSHISGKRELIQSVSQEAVDLLFDGLMVEVHCNPDVALSDKEQQLTPAAFKQLMDSLKLKAETTEDSEFLRHITLLREDIDKIDTDIIKLLGERMERVEKIGDYKKKCNVAVLQPDRWKEILKSRIEQGEQSSLSSDFIENLYKLIHEEAFNRQERSS